MASRAGGLPNEDGIASFHNAIRAFGLEPPNAIVPGRLYRFPGVGKRQSNRAGWCRLFPDGSGGCFGDWSSGLSQTWQTQRLTPLSHAERERFQHRIAEAKAQAQKQHRKTWEAAATRAGKIWASAGRVDPNHPYLHRKGIRLNTEIRVRQRGRPLVLPVTDFTGKLTSLQFIAPDGGKRLLSGGRKRGCFIHVHGDALKPAKVILCEGWATGCTLAEDEPAALVLAAIDAGNLEPVTIGTRHRWPSTELIVAGDDDRLTPGNPGATNARKAAIAAQALLALPRWPAGAPYHLTDFNDLVQWQRGRFHE